MVGEMPTYRFVGYASADELIRPEAVKDLGRGPTFAMTQDQLTLFEDWDEYH